MADRQSIATDRFGLGRRPGDAVPGDMRGWLTQQLRRFDPAPPALAELTPVAGLFAGFSDMRTMRADMRRSEAGVDDEALRLARQEQMQGDRDAMFAAMGARLQVAGETDTPFAERLVHFWSNHFAVSLGGLPVNTLAADHEFAAIRPAIMGNFTDLLRAAALHPAMLLFLNQAQSIGPGSAIATRRNARAGDDRQVGLNENLAREILELHTLGVRSGYGQNDVEELARALTGWTVAGSMGRGLQRFVDAAPGTAVFVEQLHEPGGRTLLGQRFAEAGEGQAVAMLEMLARHPATARHIATKLARHFIADDPPAAAIERLERAFIRGEGDLPTLYAALIEEPEVWAAPRAKFRTPWDWTVAAIRALGRESVSAAPRAAFRTLDMLGQPIWSPGNPKGWGDTASDWASPGALMGRVELANRFGQRLRQDLDTEALAGEVLADALRPATLGAVRGAEDAGMGLALLLSSPEFMRR